MLSEDLQKKTYTKDKTNKILQRKKYGQVKIAQNTKEKILIHKSLKNSKDNLRAILKSRPEARIYKNYSWYCFTNFL